jgi:hypothetical protein
VKSLTKGKFMKTIKSIDTKLFKVELLEVEKGYEVVWERFSKEKNYTTVETIKDYGIATYLFDLKVRDLEGQ